MFKRSFVRSVSFIGISWIYMISTLFTENSAFKFVSAVEGLIPILLVPLCAFILNDKTEIELALVNGVPTPKLFFSKLIPIMIYTAIPMIGFLFIRPFKTHTDLDMSFVLKGGPIPEYVPENYIPYVAISTAVTLIFFFALHSFIRVITKNCYIPLLICLGLAVTIQSFNAYILAWRVPFTWSLFDPMIGTYFIGNKVPNAFAAKYSDLALLTNAWTYNRLLFLAISAVIFLITYLILRREKLHHGLGE